MEKLSRIFAADSFGDMPAMLQDLSPASILHHSFSSWDLETLPADAVDGLGQ